MIKSGSINLEDLIRDIGIDKATMLELLNIYCSEMSEEMQQVRLFLHNQEWTSLERKVHNIKGVSANLYLQDMFKTADILDLKLKQNDYNDIEGSINNMLDTFDNTLKSIQIISTQHGVNS